MINNYGKGGVVQIATVFGPPYMLLVEGSYEKRLFRELIYNVFRSPWFRKYISYEGHLFLKMFTI